MMRSRGPSHRANLPSHQRYALTQMLSDNEIYENVIQVLPNLRAASATQEFEGPNWKSKTTRHNVDIHEYDTFSSVLSERPRAMSFATTSRRWPWTRSQYMGRTRGGSATSLNLLPSYGTSWPNANAGVPYAVVAQCDLNCDVDEALEVLFSQETIQYESSMRALWGKKFKSGGQLRSEPFKKDLRTTLPSDCTNWHAEEKADDLMESGWISVNSTVVAPKLDISLTGKHDRTQHLCFSAYSQKSTTKNEAVFMMKTLPLDVHDQLVETSERSALRGGIDHIAVGYHLTGHYNDITGNQTRLVMCAYVSTFSGNERPEVMQWRVGLHDASDRANPDAKHIVMQLAKAACGFEKVIRRRRFGQHPFIYTMMEQETSVETSCTVCDKEFGLLRRNQFCQLCGHHVCRSCSRKYEVEPLSGGIRKNRVCYSCASRVENCVFKPQGSLGENKSTASTWYETIEEDNDDDHYQPRRHNFDRTLLLPADALESPKPGHQLAEALFSPHPLDRARALEVLKKAVKQVTQEKRDYNKPLDPILIRKYLEARERLTSISSNDYSIEDNDSGRSFPVFSQPSFGSGHSVFEKERRIFNASVETEPEVLPNFNGDGLDAICEIAAQRMKCPMAFVSVLGNDEQHIVGAYQAETCVYQLPRNQSIRSNGLLADGRPLVVKSPVHDVRFRRMPIIHEAGIQFFVGFPIKDRNGAVMASLCTVDTLLHDDISHDDISHDDHTAMIALTKLAADIFNEEDDAPVPFTPRSCY